MSAYHGCIWIDHREARVFSISRDGTDEIVLHDTNLPKHIHRKADQVHMGKAQPDHQFFDEVAGALGAFRAIVIMGPGTARSELAGYISERYPLVAKKVWGIEAMDHPTDNQIVAAARKYFNAADRIHR